jgi:hypothetical protein
MRAGLLALLLLLALLAAPSAQITQQTVITPGQGITVTNGGVGAFTLAASTPLDRSTTEQDVNTTAVETSVYSFSVPGATLSTNHSLRFTLTGSFLDNAGGSNTLVIRFKYGATTLATFNLAAGAANANRMWISSVAVLNANGATGSQRSAANLYFAQGPTTDGLASSTTSYNANHGAVAIDSTAAQTFTATVQLGISNANLSFRRYAAILEVLP